MIKKIIKKFFKTFGFEINRISKINKCLYHKLYSKESINNKMFYNIGAGNFYHPYWTNVDYSFKWYKNDQKAKFISHNLFSREHLPVEDNIVEIVYSSHTLEHIDDKSVEFILKEFYRILKPTGLLRLTMPNVDLVYQALKQRDHSFFSWIQYYSKKINMKKVQILKPMSESSIYEIFLFYVASQRSQLHKHKTLFKLSDNELEQKLITLKFNDFFDDLTSKCDKNIQFQYPGNHMNWWNYEKITKFLKRAGFNNIIISGKGQSISPVMRDTTLFDNTHPEKSLFVDVLKK